MIAPCKDCQNREIGCHANCGKYANWRQEKQDEAARKRQESWDKDTFFYSLQRKGKKLKQG